MNMNKSEISKLIQTMPIKELLALHTSPSDIGSKLKDWNIDCDADNQCIEDMISIVYEEIEDYLDSCISYFRTY